MIETYTLVVSSEDLYTDDELDRIIADQPQVTAWHRSQLCPKGQCYLISESRLQRAIAQVLAL